MALCLRVVTLLSLAGWITSGVLAAPPAPQPVRTFAGHADSVRSVAFSRDGKTLASGSFDKTAKLWNVDSGELLGTLRGHGNAHPAGGNLRPGINRVAFTPDGTILATAGLDGTVKLWDVATKKELRTLRGHSNRVLSVAIAPDGKTLASASEDHSIMYSGRLPLASGDPHCRDTTVPSRPLLSMRRVPGCFRVLPTGRSRAGISPKRPRPSRFPWERP